MRMGNTMNQRLSDRLDKLPELLAEAKSIDAVDNAIVEVERLVLKSNYESHQSGSPEAAYEARDYVVGERNTRGLDWKLRTLRVVADANFCRMVRVGVHGGQTRILGQPENIDITLRIFETLVPALDAVSKTEFTNFSDGQNKEENAPVVHRAGWINKFLIEHAPALGTTIQESREKDAGSNGKLATMVSSREAALQEFANSLVPAKPAPAPKTPKAKAAPSSSANPEAEAGTEAEPGTPEENTGESAVVESMATKG